MCMTGCSGEVVSCSSIRKSSEARRNRPERKAKHRPGAGSSEATSVVAVFCERFSLMAPSRPGAEPCLEPTGRMARRKILGAQRYTRARVSSSAHPLFIVMRLLHFVGSFCTGWYSGAKAISRVVSSSRAAGVRTTPARIGSSPVWKYQHASIAASSASTGGVCGGALHSRHESGRVRRGAKHALPSVRF